MHDIDDDPRWERHNRILDNITAIQKRLDNPKVPERCKVGLRLTLSQQTVAASRLARTLLDNRVPAGSPTSVAVHQPQGQV